MKREKRMQYKTKGKAMPMIRRAKAKRRAATDAQRARFAEEKKLRLQLSGLENRLRRIESKERIFGVETNPRLKKRLDERISVLKEELIQLEEERLRNERCSLKA